MSHASSNAAVTKALSEEALEMATLFAGMHGLVLSGGAPAAAAAAADRPAAASASSSSSSSSEGQPARRKDAGPKLSAEEKKKAAEEKKRAKEERQAANRAAAAGGGADKKEGKKGGRKKGADEGGATAAAAAAAAASPSAGAALPQPPKLPLLTADEIGKAQFGYYPLVQSTHRTNRTYTTVGELNKAKANTSVLVRGRVHTSRLKGKTCFIVLRSGVYTVQVAMFVGSRNVTAEMIKWANSVPRESVIEVEGDLVEAPQRINAATQDDVELHAVRVYCVSQADLQLPLIVEDASRPEPSGDEAAASDMVRVNPEVRLENRVLDLRVPAHIGIFRVQSGMGQLFREFLCSEGFIEIHTPKLIAGASEGGTEVFKLDYFGTKACLAQSPQLYKQMAVEGDLTRVFEIGPVFRAENSNTHRHLTEFVGLDIEMEIKEHYHEVLDVLDRMFVYMFSNLETRFAAEIAAVQRQYGAAPIAYNRDGPNLRLTFAEGVRLLKEAGVEVDPYGDLDTASERTLGAIVKEKYGTDFYMLEKYPKNARPFYTMPCPVDPNYTNSYDIFLRGEEISSGAQRVHCAELLVEQIRGKGLDPAPFKAYIDAFRFGAWPHGGAGIGLERIVMLFLGVVTVRRTSMFPRTPSRITP